MRISSASPSSGVRKGFSSGTHRLVKPEETLARFEPLMPVLGITRIADVTGLDHMLAYGTHLDYVHGDEPATARIDYGG